MSLTVIRKAFSSVETKILDSKQGLVQNVFSVTKNTDRQEDIIEPGAFNVALARKSSVPVVFAHEWSDINQVLGKTVEWQELMPGDPGLPEQLQARGFGGVKSIVQFELGVPAGQIAYTHVANRNLTEWSFAFTADDEDTDAKGIRHIKSINEIFEVTLALVGANPDTVTMALKGFSPTPVRQRDPRRAAFLVAAIAALIDS